MKLTVVEKGDLAIGVGHSSTRKRPIVTVKRGSTIYTVASCLNEEEAERLLAALVEITDAKPGRDDGDA